MMDKFIRTPTLRDGHVSQEGLNINRNSDGRIAPTRAPSAPPERPHSDRTSERERFGTEDREHYNR